MVGFSGTAPMVGLARQMKQDDLSKIWISPESDFFLRSPHLAL